MNNENAKNEDLLKNAMVFLRQAIVRGDQQALEIMETLQNLDQEFESVRAKVASVSSRPRHTRAEYVNFYQVTIPALDRLIEIQKELQCIALQVTNSNYKRVAGLLKQIKQRTIVQDFLNN